MPQLALLSLLAPSAVAGEALPPPGSFVVVAADATFRPSPESPFGARMSEGVLPSGWIARVVSTRGQAIEVAPVPTWEAGCEPALSLATWADVRLWISPDALLPVTTRAIEVPAGDGRVAVPAGRALVGPPPASVFDDDLIAEPSLPSEAVGRWFAGPDRLPALPHEIAIETGAGQAVPGTAGVRTLWGQAHGQVVSRTEGVARVRLGGACLQVETTVPAALVGTPQSPPRFFCRVGMLPDTQWHIPAGAVIRWGGAVIGHLRRPLDVAREPESPGCWTFVAIEDRSRRLTAPDPGDVARSTDDDERGGRGPILCLDGAVQQPIAW